MSFRNVVHTYIYSEEEKVFNIKRTFQNTTFVAIFLKCHDIISQTYFYDDVRSKNEHQIMSYTWFPCLR